MLHFNTMQLPIRNVSTWRGRTMGRGEQICENAGCRSTTVATLAPKSRRLIRGVRQAAADVQYSNAGTQLQGGGMAGARVSYLAREGGRFGISWCNG